MNTRYSCPCCGYLTLKEEPPGSYCICQVCFWEDDPIQSVDPSYRGGANTMSLDEARRNFERIGAIEERALKFVRSPRRDEYPPNDAK